MIMPIYEYRCSECQQVFEEWVKHAEDENVRHACPVCKGAAKRIMSHTSFALKGTGWYATDYGSHKNDTAETTAPKNSCSCTGTSTPESGTSCAGSGCSGAGCSTQPAS